MPLNVSMKLSCISNDPFVCIDNTVNMENLNEKKYKKLGVLYMQESNSMIKQHFYKHIEAQFLKILRY